MATAEEKKKDTGTLRSHRERGRERGRVGCVGSEYHREKWTCPLLVISGLNVDLVLFICGLTSNHPSLISLLPRPSRPYIFSSLLLFSISSPPPSDSCPSSLIKCIVFFEFQRRFIDPKLKMHSSSNRHNRTTRRWDILIYLHGDLLCVSVYVYIYRALPQGLLCLYIFQ